MNKVCSSCKMLKNLNDFPKDRNVKSGYGSRCKDCRNIYLKKYRKNEKHKEIAKLYNKKYSKENRNALYENWKDYLKTDKGKEVRKKSLDKYNKSEKRKQGSLKKFNNSDKRRIYARKWVKNKRDTNINFRLKTCISASIRFYFKKNNTRTIDIIGYSIEELKVHLENQFTEEMTWENYGTFWSIDHIIPQSLYNFLDKDEIKKCWCLKNLRPLKIKDNASKSNKVDEKLIEELGLRNVYPKLAHKMETK